MSRFIPVSEPTLAGNEKKYVLDCLQTNWISSIGKYIEQFEEAFAAFCGVKHAMSCCNGTAALHVALLTMGVGPGDEVIVPTLTFVATASAVNYCGARPVMVDSEAETWNMDPTKIEQRISSRTKGIIAVHLYGHPADMDPILSIARKHHLFVLEDAAEAHGAEYKKVKVGALGDVATFSFYGNKIITTGEGGMIVTNDPTLAARVRQLKGQGMDPDRRYWFPMIGFNYRMSNVAAAIGLAQLERIDYHLSRRREIAEHYINELARVPGISIQPEEVWARNVYWMTSAVLEEQFPITRDDLMAKLAAVGIETRPFFYPMHTLPMYQKDAAGLSFPVADRLSKTGLNLPSSASLSNEDVNYVCAQISRIFQRSRMTR
jgi:perosamine synthetase